LTYGIPVIFGPNYTKFEEAKEALQEHIGFTIATRSELNSVFSRLTGHPDVLSDIAQKSKLYINSNTGSARKVYDYIQQNGFLL